MAFFVGNAGLRGIATRNVTCDHGVQNRLRRQKAAKRGKVVVIHILDPLLATLAHFNSNTDLTMRIDTLFNVLDIDDSRRSVCLHLLSACRI